MRNVIRGFLVCLMAWAATSAYALINPTFTPVQLVGESQTIVLWKAKPAEEFHKLEMTLVKAMKGEWKEKTLTVAVTDESLMRDLEEEAFAGDPETAVDTMAFLNKRKDGTLAGAIRVGDKWFTMVPAEGGWGLAADEIDMKAVWDGDCRMLTMCVDYLLKTPGGTVPVKVGAEWATKKKVGSVAGKDIRIAVATLEGAKAPSVIVRSDSGKLVFAYDAAKKEYAVQAGDVKLPASLETDPAAAIKFDESARDASTVGAAGRAMVADFDGDFIADALLPFEQGALFFKGAADGTFAAPKPAGKVQTGKGGAQAWPADLDGDGLLDVLVLGKQGLATWMNMGGGQFQSNYHVGEPDYIAKQNCSGGAVGDFNSDGRMDFVICYEKSGPHFFFSRGFATFGFAAEMDVIKSDMFGESGEGQLAAQLADLNGDGAVDCVMVLKDGTVWVLERSAPTGPALALRAELKGDVTDVLRVEGYDGDVLAGSRVLAPGTPAFFFKKEPGPLKIKDGRLPKGEAQEKEVLLIDAPVRVVVGAGGAEEK